MALFDLSGNQTSTPSGSSNIFGSLRDEEAYRRKQARRTEQPKKKKKKEEEKDDRSFLSKAFDQLNILDSGRSFETARPSEKQAKRSALSQLGDTVGASYKRAGEATGESIFQLTSGDEQQAEFQQGQNVLQGVIDKATKRLQDPNLTPQKRAQFERLRAETIKSRDKLYGQRTERLTDVIEKTDPVKGAAAIGSIGFDVATLGSGARAARTAAQSGIRRAAGTVAQGAAEGAVSGGLGAVEQAGRDVTASDIARGAAIGGAAGAGIAGLGAGVGEVVNRQLSKKATRQTSAVLEQSARSQGVVPETTIHLPDKGIYARITPEQAAKLKDEVGAVVSDAKDTVHLSAPTNLLKKNAKEVPLDEILARSPNAQKTISALEAPQPQLGSDIVGAQVGGVPRAAQRTEALAIQKGLADEGFDLKPTAKINMADQADRAINIINTDYDAAKRIALGEVNAPGDLQASVMYEAVKQRAAADGDAALLYRLAKESSVPTQGKEAGQFIKGFDYKNPEDPTNVMRDIIKAREESKVKGIPRDLTPDEADNITKMSRDIANKKAAIADGGDPLDYGTAVVNMRRYKNDLIDATKSTKEKFAPKGLINATFGTAKSLKASLDNSFFGRQGFKVLTTHPTVWGRAFKKSWGDIAKGLSGKDALDYLDAEILSRPNSINGVYKRMGLDVHSVEEAFPSSLPEKVPGLGRMFKASEYAYTGGAHRMRADLADQLLDKASRAGVDITDKKQLDSLGKLINSMTGRGELGRAEPAADVLNNMFFSPRNWKSNIDTITAHQLQKGVTPFVRKEAAKNLLKMIAATSAVMTAAHAWKPGSVEWDPRSSNFGKIKIGNTRFDVTGGMASIATVASRIATQETKSSTSDRKTKLNSDEFGARSTWDVLLDYAEGKMSPGAQLIKQIMTGKDFVGNDVTPASLAKDFLAPLPITNYQELRNDPKSANALLAMVSDALGVGTNTYSANKDWNQVNSKRIQGFKKEVDAETFAEANNAYNEQYNAWFERVRANSKWKNISEETKKTLINSKKQDLTDEVLKDYGYEYKIQRKSSGERSTINKLKDL